MKYRPSGKTTATGGVSGYLLDGTLGLEKDASSEQFSEDTAHGPDVDGVGVMTAAHQDLGRSVVLRHHFLSHVTRLVRLLHTSQAKVTDLQRTVHTSL